MSDVPHDIILEILSRLPVKSLCRFRCVSKPWRTLITDHEFVKKHLNLVKKHEPLKSMRVMMQQYSTYIKSCSLHTLFHESPGLAIELNHPQKNLRHRLVVVGSCNGLVCFVISKTDTINMFIWNPTTGESMSCEQPLSKSRATLFMMGFGYDCSNDDYIAVLELIACDDKGALKRVVGVYSMRTKSWRMIERVDYCVRGRASGKLVNGALHWVATRRGEDDDQLILSLDLVDLVFREVPKPHNYGCDRTIIYVQVFGESLGILCNRPGSYVVDLWIMKEYGVKESWTKLLTLQCPPEMNRFNYSRSLCFSMYGVILTFSGRKLVLYDINKNTFTCPVVDGDLINCEVEIFMETLVSPNAYCEQGEDFLLE